MKSMKKMLCLLLVAMLLVAAIPVAASASEFDATTVNYTVYFAVQKGSEYKFSSAVAVTSVSSDANDDAIRAAGASAAAAAGFSVVTKDAIADRVAANGNADFVHNVVYGEIYTYVDRDKKEVKYILPVTERDKTTVRDVNVDAKIFIDKEGTGIFVDTHKTVKVTLVATDSGTTTTYAMKSNGGASVTDIQGALGANYTNKSLSMRMECPTGTANVVYYVTVTGTNGSTGTNVPSTDGNSGNNGVPGASGSTNGNNNTTGTIPNGNGSSSNGGSTGNGSSNGTMNFPATVNFRVNGKVVYQAYVTNQTQLDEAKAHVITVVRNMGYQVTSWNGF